jgi:hypothetical protein
VNGQTLVISSIPALRHCLYAFCVMPFDTLIPHKLPDSISRMAPPNNREQILQNLRKSIDNGEIIVGAGAGIGLSAKFIEQGGGDLIIIYNSGRYRMAGRGSLAGLMPYGNANDVVLEMVNISCSAFGVQRRANILSGRRGSTDCAEDTSTSRCMRNRSF